MPGAAEKGPIVVAIDGPAGSGKSTLASRLAAELGLPYVNTGLMYRALAHRALAQGVDHDDGPALERLLRKMTFEIDRSGRPPALLLDGTRPPDGYAASEVENSVSAVARHPEVRRAMVELQRGLGREGAVMEGRDIGTVVFPEAPVKIYLDAAPHERAERRARERKGSARVAEGMAERDSRDERVNPFVPAPNAVRIDTTTLGADAVLNEAVRIVRERLGGGT